MSRIIFLSIMLMTFVSCGMPEEGNKVGSYRKFEPISISDEDYSRLQIVCKAIKNKESTLQQMVDNKVSFTYEYGEKTCEAETIEAFNLVQLNIKNLGQDFEFVPLKESSFGYRSVETSKVGLMADVCNNLTSRVSPIIASNGAAIWFGSIVGNKNCQSARDATCVVVELAKKTEQDTYQVHTQETIKFNLNGSREGFFSERKTFSSIGCPAGEQIEKSASLK